MKEKDKENYLKAKEAIDSIMENSGQKQVNLMHTLELFTRVLEKLDGVADPETMKDVNLKVTLGTLVKDINILREEIMEEIIDDYSFKKKK